MSKIEVARSIFPPLRIGLCSWIRQLLGWDKISWVPNLFTKRASMLMLPNLCSLFTTIRWFYQWINCLFEDNEMKKKLETLWYLNHSFAKFINNQLLTQLWILNDMDHHRHRTQTHTKFASWCCLHHNN